MARHTGVMARAERLDGKVVLVTGAANGVGAATFRRWSTPALRCAPRHRSGTPSTRSRRRSAIGRLPRRSTSRTPRPLRQPSTSTVEHFGDIVPRSSPTPGSRSLDGLTRCRRRSSGAARGQPHRDLEYGACLDRKCRAPPRLHPDRDSLSAVSNGPMNAAYNAAKAGVAPMARTMRLDLRHAGVDIGLSYLTYTDTPTARRAVEDPRMQAILQGVRGGSLKPIPLRLSRGATFVAIAATRSACAVRSVVPSRRGDAGACAVDPRAPHGEAG